MSLPSQGAYGQAGAAFPGEPPSHWRTKPLWACVSCNDEVLAEDTPHDTLIRYVEISDVSLIEGMATGEELLFSQAPSRARREVRKGDVILSTVRTYLRAVAQVDSDDPRLVVSTGFAVLRARDVDPGYLRYVMTSEEMIGAVISHSKGVSYPAINAGELLKLKAAFPPQSEQRLIADFLDRETAKLDALVSEQEALLKLLEEKRAATISHVVTKGLDPNAPMKDSGVEWLGQVPAHWDVIPLKLVVRQHDGIQIGPFGESLKDLPLVSTGFKLYGQQNIISGDFEAGDRWISEGTFQSSALYKIEPGSLLVTRKASLGNCRIVPAGITPGWFDSDSICIRPDPTAVDADFLQHLLHEAPYVLHQVALAQRGAVLGGINTKVIGSIKLALGTVGEQRSLLVALRQKLERIDALAAEAQSIIILLRERRAALVSAAVTGRIDVRDTAKAPADVGQAA